ncbi:unnamed protein product [Calicophoron daubneyi]|uniref:FMP27 C-terminal domain-containing protein n=1 Tax=Calicophoron daubneyi TaxID=300641 RepID=A0AAV2SZC2_CALDB
MCLARVARPIRRGSLFFNTPPRKPNFSRLLQSVDFSFSLPQLELTYWVSYAKRTGVRATTGPIQMMAELRNSIALESKVHLDSRRGSSPHQYVMMPPMNSYQQSGLIRRTSSVWSVVRLSATMHDSRIRLVHHPDLPGQVVQMLMKSARQIQAEYKAFNPTGSAQFPWMEDVVDGIDVDSAEDFIMVPLLRYEQVTPSQLPSGVSVRVHIPGRRSNSNSMNTSFAETAPRENEVQIGNITSTNVGTKHFEEKTDLKVPPAAECINLSHETLTPTHRLEMSDLKLRWTEHNRNLVYTLMDTYQHAKSLKRNLSARATHGFQLRTNQSGPGTALNRVRSSGAINAHGFRSSGPISGPSTMPNLNARVQDQRDAISLAAHSERIMRDEEFLEIPSISVDKMNNAHQTVHPKTPAHALVCPATAHSAVCISETDDQLSYLTPQNWESQSISDHGLAPGLADIPMLAQLLEEVDTARFYAYCEEEPKQTDVVGQLQGLAICASSLVSARNWHVELINSQLLLKTDNLTGYVLVTAARAKLDALAHPPVWRDSQLLAKSSLVGHLECMQYYATVGKVDPGTPNQWLSTGDVSDWVHFNPNADEDALSGRPEVVGCGRSVGGVVNACVSCRPTDPSSLLSGVTAIQSDPIPHRPSVGTPGKPSRPIQLQRMISRCSCQVFYVHYEPADPSSIPTHLIPSLPLDESEVVSTQEGGDTVTLLHHTLNICTNSLQYHMIVDIVNDLLLYVEPQRKAQSERNRVEFGLMSESQVRVAILRDQEALRYFVADQRRLERYLWSFVKQTMSSLNLDANASGISNEPVGPQDLSDLARAKHSSDNALKLSVCIECARQIETQIANLKTKIVSRNAILSQRLAHYQQLQIQAQRQHMRVAMNARSHSSSDMRVSSQASSSSASLLKQRKVDDTSVLSCANSINPDGRSLGHGGVQTSSSPEPSKSVLSSQIGDVRVSADPNASISVSKHIAIEHKHDSYPAEVVRRSEVCFEHASWRMTENDGQIGLADVELRGFLYAKTHRQDDSGSHWLELGWIRVASLAPDSFYKEVLAPDVVGGHYAGGPILRIACSELPPVGGLSVKGAMEISVAPMSLQISKQFYRIMMPYFFPEKSEESDAATTESVNGTVEKALDSTATGSGDRQSHHILIPDLPDSGPTDSRDNSGSMVPPTLSSSSPTQSPVTSAIAQRSTGWIRRRLYQPQNLLRYLYRGGGGSHTVPPPPILPPGAGSAARLDESSSPNSRTRKSPRSSDTPESNLTVEAALAGQTNCNVDGTSEAENVLGIELNRIALHQRRMQWRKHVQGEFDPFPFQPSPFTGDLGSDLPLHSFLNTIFALQQHQAASWPLSVMPPMDIASLMSSLVEDLKELNSLSNNPPAPDSSFLTGDASNPVDVMRERARQNNVFLYIKIPGFPICLSYKGEKQKNLTDVTRFELNIPTLEYHNCVWTWLDFVMEVKTRIRKQLVREVIKKKFTPRRHIPFVRLGRAKSDRSLNLPISSARTSQLSSLGSSSTADVVDVASSAAQEERVRREVEMLLGRHAQPQVPRPGRRWPHLRTHRS